MPPQNQVRQIGAGGGALGQLTIIGCQPGQESRDIGRKAEKILPDVVHLPSGDRWKETGDVQVDDDTRPGMQSGIGDAVSRVFPIPDTALQIDWKLDPTEYIPVDATLNILEWCGRVVRLAHAAIRLDDRLHRPV